LQAPKVLIVIASTESIDRHCEREARGNLHSLAMTVFLLLFNSIRETPDKV
jgi:hypothetical protein